MGKEFDDVFHGGVSGSGLVGGEDWSACRITSSRY